MFKIVFIGILRLIGQGTRDRIRKKWLKGLDSGVYSSTASLDMIVVDIGMAGIIFIFTLGELLTVAAIWVVEVIWKNWIALRQWSRTLMLRFTRASNRGALFSWR